MSSTYVYSYGAPYPSAQYVKLRPAQDPAKRVVSLAKTIEAEAPGCLRGLKILSKIDLVHAENRLHKLIWGWGLTLRIPMSHMNRGLYWVPILHVPDWMSYMLHHEPRVLFGGYTLQEEQDIHWHLRAFWWSYEKEDSEHSVFENHRENLAFCIPYFLYLDEGRSYRKSPVMIIAWESLFGQQTRRVFKDQNSGVHFANDEEHFIACLDGQQHTGKGSSLTSRFLITAIPHQWYRKSKKVDRSHVFHGTVDEIAKQCRKLFFDGVQDRAGNRWYGVLVGVKGDSPALAKIGRLTASFMNLGRNRRMCHLCCAGRENVPWEDFGENSVWKGTVCSERPWRQPSEILQIPFVSSTPEILYRNDPFHVIKLGIGRHFTASCVIVLIFLDVWVGDSNSVEACLERAYTDFRTCCRLDLHATPHMKAFTREMLHFTKNSDFPYGGYKGSDCTLMMRWLVRLLRYGVTDGRCARPKVPLKSHFDDAGTVEILDGMLDAACACLLFLQIINHGGLWLTRSQAKRAKKLDKCFLSTFFVYCRVYGVQGYIESGYSYQIWAFLLKPIPLQ